MYVHINAYLISYMVQFFQTSFSVLLYVVSQETTVNYWQEKTVHDMDQIWGLLKGGILIVLHSSGVFLDL